MMHVYEVRPRKDKRGADLISDVLPFGRLWYGEPNAVNNAIDYARSAAQLSQSNCGWPSARTLAHRHALEVDLLESLVRSDRLSGIPQPN